MQQYMISQSIKLDNMKQLELSIWNDPNTIDKKAQELKQIKLERRNEWIKKNLKKLQSRI